MKKLWYIPAGVVLLGIIGGGVYLYKTKTSVQIVSPGGDKVISLTPTPAVPLTTWTDDAGFSFQYPKNVSVNKHEEDNDNYAHVELTNADHPGKIIVWVKDLPSGVSDLASWVTNTPSYANASVIDTTLGGQPAKKILVTAPVKMYTVGTISDSLLFYVEGTLTDSAYWQGVEDGIVGSFAFTPDSSTQTFQSSGGNAGASSGDSADESETLQ